MKHRSHGRKVVNWHRSMDPKTLRNRVLTDLRVGNFISRLTDPRPAFGKLAGLASAADGTVVDEPWQSVIVSLRVDGQPTLTIEVDPERKRVVQVRGRFNRGPTTVEAEIVARWIAVTLVAESC